MSAPLAGPGAEAALATDLRRLIALGLVSVVRDGDELRIAPAAPRRTRAWRR